MTSESQRVHPFFRSMLIVLLVVLVPYVGWTSWDYYEASALEAAISEARTRTSREPDVPSTATRSADDPVRFYAAAVTLLPTRTDLQVLDRAFRDVLDTPPSTEQVAAAEAILAESALVFELVSRASRAPVRDWSVQSPDVRNLNPVLNQIWMLLRVLSFRTHVLARTARLGPAIDSLLDQLSVLRIFQAVEPAAPPRFYRRLALDIAGDDLVWLLARAPLDSDKLALFQRAFGGDASRDAVDAEFPIPLDRQFSARELNSLTRPLTRRRVRQLVTLSLNIFEISKQPWPARLHELEALVADAPDAPLTPLPATTKQFVESALASAQWSARSLVRSRAIAVALAIERYRLVAQHPPATLAELLPDYLQRVPLDPFTGQPLLYRADSNGYRVYGVGVNGKDDGGDFGHWSGWDANSQRFAPDVGIFITR